MRFVEFKRALSEFPVFSLSDIRIVDESFDRRRLTEWKAKGYIRKIIKGHYVFSDVELDEQKLYLIASRIYHPSYVSMESALSRYGLIPESVYATTSVTTRRTHAFDTSAGRFVYRTVGARLFFGFIVAPDNWKIASPEKAILDYCYLNPRLRTADDFASLRIDRTAFLERINTARLQEFLGRFEQKSLARRIRHLMEWMDHA
jgi:predicted transcriptional regulator of viral defense system